MLCALLCRWSLSPAPPWTALSQPPVLCPSGQSPTPWSHPLGPWLPPPLRASLTLAPAWWCLPGRPVRHPMETWAISSLWRHLQQIQQHSQVWWLVVKLQCLIMGDFLFLQLRTILFSCVLFLFAVGSVRAASYISGGRPRMKTISTVRPKTPQVTALNVDADTCSFFPYIYLFCMTGQK